MKRLILLLCLALLLTGCAPQPAAPAATASPTPTNAPAPTETPAPTTEALLHGLADSYAPKSLNMFRPFAPIEITPEQFMQEMADIRALPFEARTDWFMDHELCIPQPSEDLPNMDWQAETNLWSSLAGYRACEEREMICGQKDGKMTHWTLIRSVSAGSSRGIISDYEVLFERTEGEPWKLIDILYRPQVWEGSHEEHTLLSLRTSNTFCLYDPAQRGVILTVPAGMLEVGQDDQVTRYVYDSWDWTTGDPLQVLAEDDYAVVTYLYERYPSGEIELDKRTDYGGYAIVYRMDDHRPAVAKTVLVRNPDRRAFELTSAEDLMRSDYTCPAYSELRGDMITQTHVWMTETRRIVIERVLVRNMPLNRSWKDNDMNCTHLLIRDGETLLQTIEMDALVRTLPEEEIGYSAYRLLDMHYDDRNGDGFPDLEAEYGAEGLNAYFFLWDPEAEQYVFEGTGPCTQIAP